MKYVYQLTLLAITLATTSTFNGMEATRTIQKKRTFNTQNKLYATRVKLLHDTISGKLNHVSKILNRIRKKHPALTHRLQTYNGGINLLHYAAMNGHTPIVQYLIEEQNMNPKTVTPKGYSALYFASAGGHKSTVRYLIKKCSMNWRTRNIETSPVCIALENNHEGTVRRLLKHERCIVCLDHLSKVPLNDIVLTSCCQQIMCKQTYAQLDQCPGCRKVL